MPTIVSHAAIPLALGLGLGRNVVSTRLLLVGVVASAMPDLDVVAFRFGIAYGDQLGHRGFSHSLLFAFLIGLFAALLAMRLNTRRLTAFAFVFVAAASHGLLDMMTNGGMGVAYLWPASEHRYFFPRQVIEVAPLSLRRLLGPAGLVVARSELIWIWLPAVVMALALRLVKRLAPAYGAEMRNRGSR